MQPHKTLLLAVVIAAAGMGAEPDFPSLCADLGRAPRAHPYLIFDASEKPALQERIRSDRTLSEVMEKVRLEGRRLMYATDDPPAPPRESHTRYVGSDEYLAYMNRHAAAALTLAFLY